jgi:hypothetical protein
MGHLSNNAGIQAHSAGPAFPFIVEVWETDGRPATRRYRVTGPGEVLATAPFYDPSQAQRYAEHLAVWYRTMHAPRRR